MDYFAKYCQCSLREFLIVFFILFSGCSQKQEKKKTKADLYKPVELKPFWLKGPDFIVPQSNELEDEHHAFFDGIPFSDSTNNELNVVLTTAKDSKFYYQLDTASGKVFRSKDLCPQKDVWDSYGSDIYLPPFSEAIVPRLLDQLGYPQKVIIFGEERYLPDSNDFGKYSYRVRIIGGVLEQYCQFFPCGNNREWLSRLVLIAVNPRDPKFNKVTKLSQLKEKVNWDYTKAFLENYQGRLKRSNEYQPAYRALGEIQADEAFKFAFNNGYFFQLPQMKTLKKNCWGIYNFTWKGIEKVRVNQKKKVKDLIKERKTRVAKQIEQLFSSNVIEEEEIDLRIDELITVDFSVFFRYWYKKFGMAYSYCRRFVPAANHRVAPERHWTLDYLWLFMKLEELGYVYKCSKRAWIENPKLRDGTYTIDPIKEKENCTTWELDQAFVSAEQFVNALSINNRHFVRYVEYDTGIGGSHHRVYSWIEETGKQLECKEKYTRKDRATAFPPEVEWRPFNPNGNETLLVRPIRQRK